MEKYYIWLLLTFGESSPVLSELMKRFGTAEKAIGAIENNTALVGPEFTLRAADTDMKKAEKLLNGMYSNGIHIITWESAEYPEHLRHTAEPPCVLFAYGDTSLLQKKLITVVGSRAVTPYTESVIPQITERLGKSYAITGTLSEGCDQLTCLNALKHGIPFIEIMPCGISQTYPSGSRSLRKFLVSDGGLLLTEYLPKTRSGLGTFQRRSRILGGISYVTLVLQAGEKSGALLTAEHSYAPLFVPPNDIFKSEYAGAVTAVRNGAKLYLGEKSIEKAFIRALEKEKELAGRTAEKARYRKQTKKSSAERDDAAEGPANPPHAAEKQETAPAVTAKAADVDVTDFDTQEERKVYAVIAAGREPLSPETIAEKTGLGPDELAEALLDLEISGKVTSAGNRYTIS